MMQTEPGAASNTQTSLPTIGPADSAGGAETSTIGDPLYFAVDWQQVGEGLAAVVVLAFILERALSLLFENRWFMNSALNNFKEVIAAAGAIAMCAQLKFDITSIVIRQDTWSVAGIGITGLVIAGGSKASIKLFREVLDFKNDALREREQNKAMDALEGARQRAFKAGSTEALEEVAVQEKRVIAAMAMRASDKVAKAATPAAGTASVRVEERPTGTTVRVPVGTVLETKIDLPNTGRPG